MNLEPLDLGSLGRILGAACLPTGLSSFENVISRARILGQIDKSTMTTIFNSRIGPTVSSFCAPYHPTVEQSGPAAPTRQLGTKRRHITAATSEPNRTIIPTMATRAGGDGRDDGTGDEAREPKASSEMARPAEGLAPSPLECHLRSPRTIRRARGVARVGQPPGQPAAGLK
jgi:hypothetical protein